MLGTSGLQNVTLSFGNATSLELDQIVASGDLIADAFGDINTTLGTTINIAGHTSLLSSAGGAFWIGVNQLDSSISGTVSLGTLTISTSGSATLALTGNLVFEGDNTAMNLWSRAGGSITDFDNGRITLLGDAIFEANASIVLADDAGGTGAGMLSVTGQATFIASGAIDVGITSGGASDGAASAATTAFGTITIVTPNSSARIHTDSDLVLAGENEAGSLSLVSSSSIATQANTDLSVISFATFIAQSHISLMSDSAATTAAMFIGTHATFIAGTTLDVGIQGGFGSGIDSAATVLLHDVEFQAPLGAQLSIDKSFTIVGNNSASTLTARSSDTISNTSATTLDIAGATFISAQAIALTQATSGSTQFGSLTIEATSATLHENNAMEIAELTAIHAVLSVDGSLTQTGTIDADTLVITLTAPGDVLLQDASNRIGVLSVSGTVQNLAISNSDTSANVTLLPASVDSLELNFSNAVVYLPSLSVAGNMTIQSGQGISNLVGAQIDVGGLAEFRSGGNDILLGTALSDQIRLGAVTFLDADFVQLHEI
jgi:hypothetical protein